MRIHGVSEVALWAAFLCLSGGVLLHSVAAQSALDEPANFEEEPYYPMLRRHWSRMRQVNPGMRSLMSVPVPRAGKRSSPPYLLADSSSSPSDAIEPLAANTLQYYPVPVPPVEYSVEPTEDTPVNHDDDEDLTMMRSKKFWPKYWTTFVRSPSQYWTDGHQQRPYWRL
ncbi:hypothetical protein BV898_08826 [Hypsibius exemplaris]|uniref:Uncharacterized protein n=1 Tax=Hypsibius exemplaris TaxID=2072580 RepID=A0A1W0WPK0_HYPEX|nr:hypothetical protein BV898_08826 [Hypsibius exemplaris]